MTKNHNLAGAINDASWAKLKRMLIYKAEKAGGLVKEVDAKYTSQMCSRCKEIVSKELKERTHDCDNCGLVLDRDHNAAINILHKAVVGLELPKVIERDMLATRNIILRNQSGTLPVFFALNRVSPSVV